jgi:histone-lysine N-methyltransferase SETMAR
MLIVFIDMNGIVHQEFVPPNILGNSDCDVLRHLREKCVVKKFELRRNHKWPLHHNNAPANTSLKTTDSVTNSNMVIVPHPPYSPYLAHCDFTLFPKLKMKLKG